MKLTLQAIALYLAIDIVGFTLWIASGQLPPTNIFVGGITRALLALVIN